MSRCQSERGVAMVMVMMALTLLLALGCGLAIEIAIERRLAFSYADGVEALYAAEAGAGMVALEIAQADTWNPAPGEYVSAPLDQLLGIGGGSRWMVTVSLATADAPDEAVVTARATADGVLDRTVSLGIRRVLDAGGRPALQVTSWTEGP
jgi:Tfp pilus assembly protein PilX